MGSKGCDRTEKRQRHGISKQGKPLSQWMHHVSGIQEDKKLSLSLNHPFRLVASTRTAMSAERLVDGNAWQVDILHHSPDYRQTRCLCRKGINLIGALPDIAKEAFKGGMKS
jgi:hypothetical protein